MTIREVSEMSYYKRTISAAGKASHQKAKVKENTILEVGVLYNIAVEQRADANEKQFTRITQSRILPTHATFCSLARVAAGWTAIAFPLASTSKTNRSKLAPP